MAIAFKGGVIAVTILVIVAMAAIVVTVMGRRAYATKDADFELTDTGEGPAQAMTGVAC